MSDRIDYFGRIGKSRFGEKYCLMISVQSGHCDNGYWRVYQ